jgi:hypothetical protein
MITTNNCRQRRLPLNQALKSKRHHKKQSQYKLLSPTIRKIKKKLDSVVVEAAFKRLQAI